MPNGGLKRCLGVDLGSHSVKVAEVALGKSGVVIMKLASADIELAPGTPESERESRVVRTLRDLLKKNKIVCRNAVFCVPGQQTFLRRLPALPKTTEQRLNRIIQYEADNLVPFPPDQSLRRYQVVETADGSECEVLLAAMKREHINQFMRVVGRTGLRPNLISVGPLALHNLYRFCAKPFVSSDQRKQRVKEKAKAQDKEKKEAEAKKKGKEEKKGEKKEDKRGKKEEAGKTEEKKPGFPLASLFSKKKKEEEKEKVAPPAGEAAATVEEQPVAEAPLAPAEEPYAEVVAYVNIGARNMDLSIPKQESGLSYGFTRSVPLAGDEMTLAIQRAKQLASFGEAEQLKRASVAVFDADQGAEAAPEGVDAEASKALTKVVDRMVIELRRSLDFFISQPDGVAVDAIALSGGHANLPGLRAYMEERLGVKVSVTDQPKSEALTMSDGEAPSLSPFLIAIGLGLEGLDYGELSIDFLPEEFQVVRTFKRKAPAVFAMAGCLMGMVALSSAIGKKGTIVYGQTAQDAEDKVNQLKKQDWGKKYDEASNEQKAIDAAFARLKQAYGLVDSDYWFRFVKNVQEKKPEDVVISKMDLGGAGQVTIEGYAEENVSPARFASQLKGVKPLVRDCGITGYLESLRSPLFPNKTVSKFRIGVVLNKTERMVTPIPGTLRVGETRNRRPGTAGEAPAGGEEGGGGAPAAAPGAAPAPAAAEGLPGAARPGGRP